MWSRAGFFTVTTFTSEAPTTITVKSQLRELGAELVFCAKRNMWWLGFVLQFCVHRIPQLTARINALSHHLSSANLTQPDREALSSQLAITMLERYRLLEGM